MWGSSRFNPAHTSLIRSLMAMLLRLRLRLIECHPDHIEYIEQLYWGVHALMTSALEHHDKHLLFGAREATWMMMNSESRIASTRRSSSAVSARPSDSLFWAWYMEHNDSHINSCCNPKTNSWSLSVLLKDFIRYSIVHDLNTCEIDRTSNLYKPMYIYEKGLHKPNSSRNQIAWLTSRHHSS